MDEPVEVMPRYNESVDNMPNSPVNAKPQRVQQMEAAVVGGTASRWETISGILYEWRTVILIVVVSILCFLFLLWWFKDYIITEDPPKKIPPKSPAADRSGSGDKSGEQPGNREERGSAATGAGATQETQARPEDPTESTNQEEDLDELLSKVKEINAVDPRSHLMEDPPKSDETD